MPDNTNAKMLQRVARQQLSFATEVLANIHYLIDRDCDNPNSVKLYVDTAKPALQIIIAMARQDAFPSQPIAIEPKPLQLSRRATRQVPWLLQPRVRPLPVPAARPPKEPAWIGSKPIEHRLLSHALLHRDRLIGL